MKHRTRAYWPTRIILAVGWVIRGIGRRPSRPSAGCTVVLQL